MISQNFFNPLARAYANSSNIFPSALNPFNFNPFSVNSQDFLYQSQLAKRANPYAEQEAQILANSIQKKLKTPEASWNPEIKATAKPVPEVISLDDDSDDECIIIEEDSRSSSEPLFVKDNVFTPPSLPVFSPENSLNFNNNQFLSQIANLQRAFLNNLPVQNNAQTQAENNKKAVSPVIIIDEDEQWEQIAPAAEKKTIELDSHDDAKTASTLSPKGAEKEAQNKDCSDTESEDSYAPNEEESQEATIPALCETRPTRETARRKPKQVWNPNTVERNTLEQYYIDLSKLTRKDITNEEVAINTLKMCEMDVNKTLAVVKQNRAIYRDLFETRRRNRHLH